MTQWPVSGRQLYLPETQTFRGFSTIFNSSFQDWVLWNEIIYFTFEKSAVLLVTEKASPLIPQKPFYFYITPTDKILLTDVLSS